MTSNAHLTVALVSLYSAPPPSPLTLFSSCLFCFFFATAAGLSHCVVKVNFFFRFSLAIAVGHISALFKRARGERGVQRGPGGGDGLLSSFQQRAITFGYFCQHEEMGRGRQEEEEWGADLVSLGSQLIKVNVTVVDAFYFLSLFFCFCFCCLFLFLYISVSCSLGFSSHSHSRIQNLALTLRRKISRTSRRRETEREGDLERCCVAHKIGN